MTSSNKPSIQLLKELKENKFNKKDLLEFSGYDTINQAKKILGLNKASDVYHYLIKDYNEVIKKINEKSMKKYEKDLSKYLEKEYKKQFKEKVEKKESKKSKEIKEIKKLVYKVPENNITSIRKSLQKFIGKNIIIHYIDNNGNTIFKLNFNIPSTFSSWWKKTSWEFIGEDYEILGNSSSGKIFIYEENPIITNLKIKQAFKEGITNCLLTPIKDWAIETLENSKSKSAKSRYNGIIKNVEEFEKICINGVPEDLIPEICNKLQIDISVQMPYCETKFIDCQSIKKRLKHFNFLNTRINHIEYVGYNQKEEIEINEITNLNKFVESSKNEIKEIKEKLDLNNEFNYYNKNLTTLYTSNKIYKVKSEFGEIVNEFEKDNNMFEYSIDDITQPELSKFITEGTHYNSTVDFTDKNDLVNSKYHYDMEAAYAKFYECKFYKGFLGKITDFRQCNKIEGVGLYKICNLNFSNAYKSFVSYNNKMEIYKNNCVYPSPELEMLKSMRVSFDIIAGCWGVKEFDFRFNENMLNMKEEGVKYYAKWCGLIDSHKLTKDMWFKGDYNMAQMINKNYGEGIVRWYENGEICVSYPKKHNFHKGHITAFITSYQRISVLEQLMTIDFENIKRICVDGIYFTQDEVVCKNVFRPKKDFKFGNDAGTSYISNNEGNIENNFYDLREHNAKELFIGAGGNGKTHKNLIDKGLIKILYCSPSWKLARNKQTEYGCKVQVWANILSIDPEQQNKIKRNNVLLIDEASMMTEDQKQFIFKTYSNMKLIFCGDLGYQLSCIFGTEMNKEGFDKIIKNNINYRCKDNRLLEILNKLRTMIEYDLPKWEINNWVIQEFKKFNKYIKVDEIDYKIEDMILTGTNKLKDYFTKLFDKNFGEINKYYITSNNRLYSNGEIIIGTKPDIKCEIRHSFTTHSIQGETAYHNLYIDSSKMFDSRMFYTAISRAKTLDQIFIIEPNEEMKELIKKNN